jgi:hypothetical protein
MDVFAATLRAFDLALFVFRKAQDNFERLLAIFAVKLIAGHVTTSVEHRTGWV